LIDDGKQLFMNLRQFRTVNASLNATYKCTRVWFWRV